MMRRWQILPLILTLFLATTGCSDDSVPVTDTGTGGDTNQSDMQVTQDSGSDSAVKQDGSTNTDQSQPAESGADTSPAADAGTTACGTKTCQTATEVCVRTDQQIGPKFDCVAVPSGCEQDRTCNCLGSHVCTSVYNYCADGPAGSNMVSCSCINC